MTEARGPVIRLSHVTKSFGGRRVLDDVSFDIAPGEVLSTIETDRSIPRGKQFWEPEWQATPALPALTRPKLIPVVTTAKQAISLCEPFSTPSSGTRAKTV